METQGSSRALALVVMLAIASSSTVCASSPCTRQTSQQGKSIFYDCISRGLTSFPQISMSERERTYSLHLEDNNLFIEDNNTFIGFKFLNELYLSNNRIPILRDGIFDPLVNLRILVIKSSGVHTVAPNVFANLPKLDLLSMDSNKIELLPPNVFRGLNHLADVSLTGNPLTQDYRLCTALYNKGTEITYYVDDDVQEKFGSANPPAIFVGTTDSSAAGPTTGISVNQVCGRQCNTWRPDYLKVCPDAFCKGTVANHACRSMDHDSAVTEDCPQTGRTLQMFSSVESNYWQSKDLCAATLQGDLPTAYDFKYGCVQRLLAKVRQQYNLDYTPVVWLEQFYHWKGDITAFASNRLTYWPQTRRIYYLCGVKGD
ncbi:uncharacterized protein LOC135820571 [Sycon ciliatum]|uniref:uncharacterized protein LOC135820571 n=1 Tax=Sycon ciliatum TaxID=27933 RepID=UPI0031F65BF6